ncbi:MAG: ATP-binding protein [Desulfobacterales bacterium]|nr:ATP-binding protein [Desulfobacterales bacterium]
MSEKPSYAELEKRVKELEASEASQKNLHAALKASENRFREIIEGVPEISVRGYNENREVTFWNKASESLYGYTEEEVLGRKIEDLIIPGPMKEKVKKHHKRWVESEEKIPAGEIEFIHKNGSLVPVYSSRVMHETVHGKEMFCLDIDLKSVRLAGEAIALAAETNELALVGRVAGKMAHDFNNILSSIMGHAEISMMVCDDAEIKESLELIFEQTVRGRNLTKNLVLFAKDQEPRQEYFQISQKTELVLNILKKDLSKTRVNREYDPQAPDLLADPGMIEHALVNIIQNSIHATSLVQAPELFIKTEYGNGKINIEIKDNGCGIPEAFIENIFEPSFSLKGSKDKSRSYDPEIKGTGYGLANVKKYITQHLGEIFVRSEVNRGTTVHIALPVPKKELEEDEIIKIREDNFHCEKYILLVEDEQAISDIQYRVLTNSPCYHRVDIAGNGQAAVDLFCRNKYDLISLDYMLPGQMNGMTIYRHIREKDVKVPILFISGNVEFIESIKDLRQKDPRVDHVSKPCRNLDYLRCINRLFCAV